MVKANEVILFKNLVFNMAVELTPQEIFVAFTMLDRIDEILHADDDFDSAARITVIANDADSDENISPRPPKLSFGEILKIQDQCCYFVNERKYAEAYGFMKNLYALGPQTYFVLVLAKYYITLLATEQTKKADQIRDQMAEFLQKSCTDTAKDLCDYATELRFCDEFIESVLFYQIAFAKFQNEENVENLLELPAQVSMGILLNSFELFKDRLISKTMICSYFIPIFQKIARTVESKFSFDKKLSSAAQAQCYFHAALSQELTCEFVDQEMTCIKGLALLKRHHSKASAMKMSLYSCLLELLGLVNVKLGRHDDGVQLLVQAVAAKKKTKDLKNPEEKAEDLNRVQKTLKVLQKRSSRRK